MELQFTFLHYLLLFMFLDNSLYRMGRLLSKKLQWKKCVSSFTIYWLAKYVYYRSFRLIPFPLIPFPLIPFPLIHFPLIPFPPWSPSSWSPSPWSLPLDPLPLNPLPCLSLLYHSIEYFNFPLLCLYVLVYQLSSKAVYLKNHGAKCPEKSSYSSGAVATL